MLLNKNKNNSFFIKTFENIVFFVYLYYNQVYFYAVICLLKRFKVNVKKITAIRS